MFGIISKRKIEDIYTIPISILVAVGVWCFSTLILPNLGDYKFGSELLGVNAGLVYLFLWVFSSKSDYKKEVEIQDDSEIIDTFVRDEDSIRLNK